MTIYLPLKYKYFHLDYWEIDKNLHLEELNNLSENP